MENECQVLKEITKNPSNFQATRLNALEEVELARHLLNCQVCLDVTNSFLEMSSDDTVGRRVLLGICRKAAQMDPALKIAALPRTSSCCEVFALVVSSPSQFMPIIRKLATEQIVELFKHPWNCSECQKLVYNVTKGNPIVYGATENTPSQKALIEFLMHSFTL